VNWTKVDRSKPQYIHPITHWKSFRGYGML